MWRIEGWHGKWERGTVWKGSSIFFHDTFFFFCIIINNSWSVAFVFMLNGEKERAESCLTFNSSRPFRLSIHIEMILLSLSFLLVIFCQLFFSWKIFSSQRWHSRRVMSFGYKIATLPIHTFTPLFAHQTFSLPSRTDWGNGEKNLENQQKKKVNENLCISKMLSSRVRELCRVAQLKGSFLLPTSNFRSSSRTTRSDSLSTCLPAADRENWTSKVERE